MAAIDNKVAKLSLDDSDFKSKVKDALLNFTKLDQMFGKTKNVDLSKSVSEVNKLSQAAENNKLNAITKSVDQIKSHFSAMGVVARTIIANITNRVFNAGLNIAKSLTIAPITQGLDMYESKLKSIQVIKSNTMGKYSIKEITDSLADLNDYANKTIYSFQDMTTNMGTFTAAGVDMKTAQTAIKGIANLAATSGSSTQQAGIAMYQLSQAMASGTVKLQDWNSVVNAGMGGKLFQNALQNTARKMGENVSKSKSFRDSLQDGWLTTKVLTTTLQQFANDKSMLKAATQVKTFHDLLDTLGDEAKSNWSQTWELIIGDYDQAPKLWTSVHNVLNNIMQADADARNNLLKNFDALGGRTKLLTTLGNVFTTLGSVMGDVKKAWSDIFPPVTGEKAYNMIYRLEVLTTRFMYQVIQKSDEIVRTFKGVFAALDIVWTIVKDVGKAFLDLIPWSTSGSILDLTARLGDMVVKLDDAVKHGKGFQKFLDDLHTVIQNTVQIITNLGDGVHKVFDFIVTQFQNFLKFMSPVIDAVKDSFKGLTDGFNINTLFGAGFLGGFIIIHKKISGLIDDTKGIVDKVKSTFGSVGDMVKNLGGLTDALKAMTQNVKADTLKKIAVATLEIAVAIKILGSMKLIDISKGVEALGVSLAGFIFAMGKIAAIKFTNVEGTLKAVGMIMSLATALLLISAALKIMASIKPEQMGSALIGLVGVLVSLTTAIGFLSKFSGPMQASGLKMIGLATGILILSAALKVFATIKPDDMSKGIIAISSLLAALVIFAVWTDGLKISPSTAAGVVTIATALTIMSAAMKIIAGIDTAGIVKGLVSIVTIMVAMAGFAKFVSGSKIMSAAAGMILIAAAINLLVPAFKAFASMSILDLAKGFVSIAAALMVMMGAMEVAKGGLGGAAAMLVMAVALNAIIIPIKVLGSMSLGDLAKGIGALLVSLLGFVGIGFLSTIVAPGLLALAAGTAALGVAAIGVGVGIALFAAGLMTLAALGTAAIKTIILNIGQLVVGLLKLVPQLATLAVGLVTAIAVGLLSAVPVLAVAAWQAILALLNSFLKYVPKIIVVGVELVDALAQALGDNAPKLLDAGVKLIIKLVNGLADAIRTYHTKIVTAVLNVVESILEVVVQALAQMVQVLFGWIPGIGKAADGLGQSATNALRKAFKVKDVGDKGGKDFEDGINSHKGSSSKSGESLGSGAKSALSNALKGMDGVGSSAGKTFSDALNWQSGNAYKAGSNVGNSAKSGGRVSMNPEGAGAGWTFVAGLNGRQGSAYGAGRGVGNSAKSGARDGSSGSFSIGSFFGQGFINGMAAMYRGVGIAAANLGSHAGQSLRIAIDSHSPSKVTTKIGAYFGEGFVNGIHSWQSKTASTVQNLAGAAVDAIQSKTGMINGLMTSALSISPVVTPVVDTSGLGALALNGSIKASSSALNYGQNGSNQTTVKVDNSDIINRLDTLEHAVSEASKTTVNWTSYGAISDTTARQWSNKMAVALDKVKKSRTGGR